MARNQRDSIRNRLDALQEGRPRRIPTRSEAIGRALFHLQDRRIETGQWDESERKTQDEWIEYARQKAIERGADPDEPLYERPSSAR